jgi:hypothetical protein
MRNENGLAVGVQHVQQSRDLVRVDLANTRVSARKTIGSLLTRAPSPSERLRSWSRPADKRQPSNTSSSAASTSSKMATRQLLRVVSAKMNESAI